MSKKGHQKGLLKTETIPSKPKDPFFFVIRTLPKCREPIKVERTQGLVARGLKDHQGFVCLFFVSFTGLKSG